MPPAAGLPLGLAMAKAAPSCAQGCFELGQSGCGALQCRPREVSAASRSPGAPPRPPASLLPPWPPSPGLRSARARRSPPPPPPSRMPSRSTSRVATRWHAALATDPTRAARTSIINRRRRGAHATVCTGIAARTACQSTHELGRLRARVPLTPHTHTPPPPGLPAVSSRDRAPPRRRATWCCRPM